MKNAKKLLLFVFALVALVLVMSISIFADSTEATGTVHTVTDEGSLYSAISSASDGDIVRLASDITCTANQKIILEKAITLDLYGFTLTTTQAWYGHVQLKNNGCSVISSKVDDNGNIVRGKIYRSGGTATIQLWNADKIENINIEVVRTAGSNTCGGIAIQNTSSVHVNSIKNMDFSGSHLSYAVEVRGSNSGGLVIDSIESLNVVGTTNALEFYAPVGTVTGCNLYGTNSGIYATSTATVDLQNCTVKGGASAINISSSGNTVAVVVDAATAATLEATNGVAVKATGTVDFSVPGYTYENGTVSCVGEHSYSSKVTDPTCTEAGYTTYTCAKCGNSYKADGESALGHSYNSVVTEPTCEADGYTTYTCATCGDTYTEAGKAATGHDYVETDRVDATEGANGYIEYTCNNCSGTKREELVYCSHNYVVVEKVDVSCLNAGYAKYECSLCGETKEETTEKEAHTYDWKIAGCPKCKTVAVPDTEGGKVSTNLGYTVYFAASWQEIANNVSASSTYDVIRLTNDSTVPTGNYYAQVKNKNILIDLGGHTITTPNGLASIYLYQAKGLANGTLVHGGGRQALVCYNVDFIEDVTINVTATLDKNATGMIVFSNAAYGKSYVGSMKNVTIMGNIPNHGMELQNTNTVIDSMTNVKIYSHGQAITTKANIGTMTNCVFSGDNVGLAIAQINGTFELVNCEIYGGNLAIQITGAVAGSNPAFVFGSDTKFITSGVIFDIADDVESNPDYDFSAITSTVALVNGQLYTSIDDAFNALINSTEELTTFALMQDVEIDSPIVINKKVNFSLGGGTYKIPIYGTANFDEVTVDGYEISAPNGLFEVVEGGSLTLSGDGYVLGNEATVVVNGGTVVVDGGTYYGYNPSDYVVDGCHALYNEEDDSYTIGKHDYDYIYGNTFNDGECDCGYVRGIARIGETFYMTFEEAFTAAKSGDTIYLLDTAVITKDEAYDLTGLTIHAFGDAFEVQSGATLTLNGDGRVNAGQSGVGSWCAIWANGGHVIINGGTYSVKGDATEGVDPNHQNDLIYTKNGGTVTIYGGTFKYTEGVWALNQNDKTGGAIVVYGGTFEGFDPANNASEGANTSFLADGYHSIANNNVYTVGAHNVVIDASKDATCTETGLTEGSHCSICGEIFVEQEVIDVKEHNYVAGEQAEDGSVTYTCVNGCEDAYVINNKLLNGTYYADSFTSFVFDNGTLTANGETFNYTFNVTTQTLSVEGLPEGEIAYVGGNIIYRGRVQLHQHFEENYIKEVTNPTCTSKGYTTYICQFCGPLFTADEVEALDHSYNAVVTDPTCETNGYTTYTCTACGDTYTEEGEAALGHDYVEAERVPSTSEQQGHVVYSCSVCGSSYTEDLPIIEHTHTEVEIPAVLPLPSNGHTAMTAGVKCSECGEIIVKPTSYVATTTPDWNIFGIENMSLALSNNIAINYNINVAAGYETPYMVFIYEGNEYVWTEYTTSGGRLVFQFSETRPHKMASNVEAYVYGKTADGYVVDTIPEYSIMKYCQQAIDAFKGKDDVFVKLIYDLVTYGAAVQKYDNPNISDADLVTTKMINAGYALAPTEYTGIESASSIQYVDKEPMKYYWKDVQLMLGSSTVLYYNFEAPDIDGLTVKVEYSDQTVIIDNEDIVSLGNGKYRIEINTLTSMQHIYDVKATFITADGTEASSMSWSINGYLKVAVDTFTGTTLDLMKALYVYGESIRAYFYN